MVAKFFQRLRLLVILAALLGVLLLVARAAEGWRFVLAAPPGQVMYAAAFDGFSDEWRLFEGRQSAQFVDGALRIIIDDVQSGVYSDARPAFGDFDLRVDARAVDGPTNNAYGVVFRLRDPDNYYQFMVSSDGFYRVARRLNGVEKELSTWIRSELVRPGFGVTNALRVVAVGNTFRFSINGQPALLCIPDDPSAASTYVLGTCIGGTMRDTLADNSLPTGQLGVGAFTLREAGVVVDFDNLLVFGPER